MEKFIQFFNNPIAFLIFVTFGVIFFQNFLKWGFSNLGWTGPANFVK